MSKRRGDFVTLDELLDEIGVDATRFFMLQRSHDRTVDLDLELAPQAVGREPRLLRPVCARPGRVDAPQAGGRARLARRSRPGRGLGRRSVALEPAEASPDQEAARVPGGDRRGGRATRARTGSLGMRSSSPASSPRSTRAVAWSAPRLSRSRPAGSRCRWPQRTIAIAWGCSASSAPDRCSRPASAAGRAELLIQPPRPRAGLIAAAGDRALRGARRGRAGARLAA